MSDGFSSNMDWMKGWTDVQQKTWETWSNMLQKNLTTTPFSSSPFAGSPANLNMNMNPWSQEGAMRFWRDGLEQWWRGMLPQKQISPEQAVFRNMMSAGEQFQRMAEEVFKSFHSLKGESGLGMENWTELLDQTIQSAKKQFSLSNVGDMSKGLQSMWAVPLEMWKGVVASPSIFPGQMPNMFNSNLPNVSMDAMRSSIEQLMTTPAVGITRETQMQMQEGMPHFLEFQEAQSAYMKILAAVAEKAFDNLHKKLLELGASDKPLGSLQQVYDLWVDCSEDAYGEVIVGEEYRVVNAKMTNSLFKIKQFTQKMLDDNLRKMNMPTRQDLDAAYRALQDQKRRLRSLEDEVRTLRKQRDLAVELKDLRDDIEKLGIAELRAEVDRLRQDAKDRQRAVTPPAAPKTTPAPVAEAAPVEAEEDAKSTKKPRKKAGE